MAITLKTITGKIVIPGTTIGIRATVTATPMTNAQALTFPADNVMSWGPVVATTDANGMLPASFKIPTSSDQQSELLWKFTAVPVDKHSDVPKSWLMGHYSITGTGTIDLADLVDVDVSAFDQGTFVTLQSLVASASASATAAAASATSAAASASTASTLVTTDLGTTDGQSFALVTDPNSLTRGALDDLFVGKGSLAFNVKDYGATGDGVTVDTQSFRDAASAAGTGTVVVPAGTYLLDNSVSYPCTFLFMPGATVTNGGKITGSQVSLAPRDYDALMGVGYFNIWLEGNTFASPATGTHVATLWRVFYDGTAGTFNIDQAGGPFSVGAGNGLQWDQTVAGTGDTYRMLEFRIEDASTFNNDQATLSLIAQAGAGTVACTAEVVQSFGSGGSPSSDVVVATQAFTVTTASQRFQFTMSVPSIATKTFGTAMDDSLKVRLKVPTNATFNVVFKQVRLERGNVRSNFSQIPLSMEHAYIARYLQPIVISLGSIATAASQYTYCPIPFNSEMRRAPTITWSAVAGASTNNVSVGPTATHIQKFGATAYIASTAAGPFNASGQLAMLDARL